MWGYGPQWGMMGGYGYGGYGLFHMIFWVVALVAIVFGVVWLVRSLAPAASAHNAPMKRAGGLDILEQRYARGEIDRDEYLQKKTDLLG